MSDPSKQILHAQFDGAWHPDVSIPDQGTKTTPGLAPLNDQLHMVHVGEDSNLLWHSVFDANLNQWTTNIDIPNQLSRAQPALAQFRGQLHMVHIGDTSNHLWHSVFDGTKWSENVSIPNQLSQAPPALAEFDGALHMEHYSKPHVIEKKKSPRAASNASS